MTMSDKLFDKRLVERNLRNNLVTREQYERHLEALPDRSAAFVRLGDLEEADDHDEPEELEGADEDEDDEDDDEA